MGVVMAERDEEIHAIRARNNMWLGGVLAAFVVIVFGITISKMMRGDNMEVFDHVRRPQLEASE